MAITADTNRAPAPGNLVARRVPMAAATTIPVGALVSKNAAGYAINATDTANTAFMGVCLASAANSGSAGDEFVTVGLLYTVELTHDDDIAVTDVGEPVYVVDNDVVGLAGDTTNNIHVGFVSERLSATKARIEIRPILAPVAPGT
jgi:hypothetical protein